MADGMWIDGFALQAAITCEVPVLMTYVDAAGDRSVRVIEPYALAPTLAGEVIVRAMDRKTGEPRSFRLDRIVHLQVLRGRFVIERAARPRGELTPVDRIRAEIALIPPTGYEIDAAHWTPPADEEEVSPYAR